MARTVRDASLDTRSARLRLPAERKHWRLIEGGLHLGYRRGPRGGAWLARRHTGGRYVETVLGASDDKADPDGLAVRSYRQAIEAARLWWQEAIRREKLGDCRTSPLTVNDALDDYFSECEQRGAKSLGKIRSAAASSIRPELGTLQVADLTTKRLKDWHAALVTRSRRRRSARDGAVDEDALRSRRATANRHLTILKAALNHAFKEEAASDDRAWRRVRPFKGVDKPLERYLVEAEVKRLINAAGADPDFRALVRGAIYTGARYGELARMQVADLDLENGTAAIKVAKSGKPRHVVLTAEAVTFLRQLVAGRERDALVFMRGGREWRASEQLRPMREACNGASIQPPVGFHILRHSHATMLVSRGVPMAFVADQLGHADLRMTTRHYGHVAPDAKAQAIRAQFPALGGDEATTVTPFAEGGRP